MIKIITFPDLLSVIENKYLLLDTNVFIDTSLNPVVFIDFLNSLKSKKIALTTIELVKMEFYKGAPNLTKCKEKEDLINSIIHDTIAITPDITKNVFDLINKYALYGKSLSITDFYLGACLLKFKKNLFLLTKNTTEFPQNIFKLVSVINVIYSKGIHSYGLYQSF